MVLMIEDDDTDKIDAEKCLNLGGKWNDEKHKCVVASETDAISDGEKVAVIPEGKEKTIIVRSNQFEDVSGDYNDGKKHYIIKSIIESDHLDESHEER